MELKILLYDNLHCNLLRIYSKNRLIDLIFYIQYHANKIYLFQYSLRIPKTFVYK